MIVLIFLIIYIIVSINNFFVQRIRALLLYIIFLLWNENLFTCT